MFSSSRDFYGSTTTLRANPPLYLLIPITFLSALLLSFFASSFFLSPKPSHADSSTIDISLTVEPTTTISASTTCSMSLGPTTPFDYCDTTATINSNNSTGYYLYLSSPEETTTSSDNTCIRHSSTIPPTTTNPTACGTLDNSHKFTPTTTPTDENGTFITLPSDYTTNPNADLSPFTKGTWGVSYTSTTATSGTNYTKFTGLPSYASTPLKVKDTDNVAISDTTTIRSAAHYNLTSDTAKNQATGSYQGKVLFTVVNKPLPASVNPGDWGFMQNFTTTECSQMANYNASTGELMYTGAIGGDLTGTNTVKLTDSRNEQTYRIRKMQDGRCWMIDNLKIYDVTLTPIDSDITSGFFVLPSTLNTASALTTDTNFARIDDPEVGPYVNPHDSNTTPAYCSDNNGNLGTVKDIYPDTTTGCGYLYNWYAATAGKGTASLKSTTVTDSICPKNWNLPANGIYGKLNSAISLKAGGSQSFQAPYAGYLYTVGFRNQGTGGDYWSSSAHSSAANAYYLYFYSSGVSTANNYDKFSGFAIRCIL